MPVGRGVRRRNLRTCFTARPRVPLATSRRARYCDHFHAREVVVRRMLLLTACLAALSGGCMTVVNHSPFFCPDESLLHRPFGGVRGDAEILADNALTVARGQVKEPRELAGLAVGTALCVIDLPLSFIADAIWLPHDLLVAPGRRGQPPAPSAPEPAAEK